MEVIINHKHLDSGLNIIQLEQAVGAAIKSFNGAHGKYENSNKIGVSWESNLIFPSCCGGNIYIGIMFIKCMKNKL